jgi:hypothetical protein
MNKNRFFIILAVLMPALLTPAAVFSKTSKTTPPWSNLKTDMKKDMSSCNSSEFITNWIINNKPVKYCILISEEKKPFKNDGGEYMLESLKMQIESSIRIWLNSISQSNFSVMYKKGAKIDLSAVKVSYQEQCTNDGQTLVFFFQYPGQSLYACSRMISDLPYDYFKNAMKKYPLNPAILVGDSDAFWKIYQYGETNDQTLFQDRLKKIIENASQYPGYDKSFCDDIIEASRGKWGVASNCSSFFAISHELGHAFGLGDEYNLKSLADDKRYGTESSEIPKILSRSRMLGWEYLWPTCDDVQGLVYMFDKMSGYKRGRVNDTCPWRKGGYVNGQQDGDWEYYDPDDTSRMVYKNTYKLGKSHGLALRYNDLMSFTGDLYYDKDKLRECVRNNNGEKCGASYEYYERDGKDIRVIVATEKDCPRNIPQCPETTGDMPPVKSTK